LTNGDWSQLHYVSAMDNIETLLMDTYDVNATKIGGVKHSIRLFCLCFVYF
jgi:hypothetical protein